MRKWVEKFKKTATTTTII
jgi:hypothetical protein